MPQATMTAMMMIEFQNAIHSTLCLSLPTLVHTPVQVWITLRRAFIGAMTGSHGGYSAPNMQP